MWVMRLAAACLGIVALLPGLAALLPGLAVAQMYRWEDDQGTIHYGNTPTGGREPAAEQSAAEQNDASSAYSESRGPTRIAYAPGEPILVSATIGGAGPLTLILDTGADRTMIAPQALARLGISLADAPRAQIAGVTGTTHGEVVKVASLEVGEAKAGPLSVIAHDANLQKADGLLGRDFLEQFTVTIDSSQQVVTLIHR
jgi:hypothetical protein